MQNVVGNKVRLMTRGLFACINTRASWNAPVLVTQRRINELHFWKNNVEKFKEIGKHIKDERLGFYSVFSDSSSTGYGGFIVQDSNVDLSHITESNEPFGLETNNKVCTKSMHDL